MPKSRHAGASAAPSTFAGPHLAIIMGGNGRWATAHGLSRSAGHEAGLRTAIEKGQQLDPALIEKLTSNRHGADRVEPIQFKLGGIVTTAAGIGICLLSFFISRIAPPALYPILGGGVLVICVGVGLLIGAKALAEARERERSRNAAP